MTTPRPAHAPRGLLLLGACGLAVGLALAVWRLPEWERPPARPERAVELVRQRLAPSGGRLENAAVRLRLGGSSYADAFRLLGPEAVGYAREAGDAYAHRLTGTLTVRGAGSGDLEVDLLPDGRFRSFEWSSGSVLGLFDPGPELRARREELFSAIRPFLLGESRAEGPEDRYRTGGLQVIVQPLAREAGRPAECLVAREQNGLLVSVSRELADPLGAARSRSHAIRAFSILLPVAVIVSLLVLVVLGVFLARRRISFRIGLLLAGLAVGCAVLSGSLLSPPLGPGWLFLRLVPALFVLLAWSAGEAVIRASEPGFSTSLDAILSRRLGPRAGRSLLSGLALGALLCGLRLAAPALTTMTGGLAWPAGPSFHLPFFSGLSNPLAEGPLDAGELILFVGLLRLVMRRSLAEPVGALSFALLSAVALPLEPWPVALAQGALQAAVLLWAFRSEGLTALLVAATSAGLWRELLGSGRLADHSVPSMLAVALLATLAVAGVVALGRPATEEQGKLELPDFVKRLESERRVQTEMGLLTRMQLSLLPERPPEGTGLDLAARTLLATEVGGDLYDFLVDAGGDVWVAAGDVSGHGYSCAIQQAMVKAALVSLVKAGSSPGEILVEVDRVLRTARAGRLFTSLVLLRVTPASGRVRLANAGHPFPLLVTESGVSEVAAPGLPLGQGPGRAYEDLELVLKPGSALVIASDGLYEGPDSREEPYGYARPPAVLGAAGLWRRPAEAQVEALLADWRLHVGDGAPEDDTTVVAVRRPTYA